MLPPLHAERRTPKDHVCLIIDLAAATALTQALAAMQPSALMPAKLHRKPVRACGLVTEDEEVAAALLAGLPADYDVIVPVLETAPTCGPRPPPNLP